MMYIANNFCSPNKTYLIFERRPISEIGATKIEKWSSQAHVYGDLDGGFPLVIFNEAMDTALVLSPATTFMSATQYSFKDPQTGGMTLTFGPMSFVEEVNLTGEISIADTLEQLILPVTCPHALSLLFRITFVPSQRQ